ncbi:hypothetical protein [Kitasatospora sp. NPDC059327]|uniref:hypothetical protein n=1 Tax=Kitasatospora sp. NPDC059327 TaxID=3346803 RepID=UPI0036A321C5
MGGDEWAGTGPYRPNLTEALRRAQEQELARDDRGFPGRHIADLWGDGDWREFILTGGTGTVLDFYALLDPRADDDFAMVRPLTDSEVRRWAPDGRPTRAQWEAALGTTSLPYPDRGIGHCTVLYQDGEPAHVGYWGRTAD